MKNPVEAGRHKLSLECGCHAESLDFEYYDPDGDDDWNELYIHHSAPSFYTLQEVGLWNRFKHGVSIIWKIITGKEYEFFSIVLCDAKQVVALREFLNDIDTTKMLYNGKDE
jgi:hypothetical protein